MKKDLLYILAIWSLLLVFLPILVQAQVKELPLFLVDRRLNRVYMDTISHIAKQRYTTLQGLSKTPKNDTLRFETLHYLGKIYRWWPGRQDSTFYYGNELAKLAYRGRNLLYQVKGMLLIEDYYHTIRKDNAEALSINFEALSLLEKAKQDPQVGWRIDLNLSGLYSLAGNYTDAIRYLTQARMRLEKGSGLPPVPTIGYHIDIEQKLGLIYNRQNNFILSERHYLAAEKLLNQEQPLSNFAYVYTDLAELYNKYEHYEKALFYAKKAEQIWMRINNASTATGNLTNWSAIACAYTGLGQDSLALIYIQKILQHTNPFKPALQRAYQALYQIHEHRQNWSQSLLYFKKYISMRDTAVRDLQSNELATIQKQKELERLTLQNLQAQQLQTQRLLTLQKQAELDRLRASFQADALTKKALLADQQRLLDNQKAQLILANHQTRQKLEQQQFQQERLKQENKNQRNWLLYIGSTLLFLVGILTLLLYSQRLRKHKTKAELQLTETRNEANITILNAQETERRRIAQDLHDDIGTSLIALRGHLPATNANAHRLLTQIITDVRTVSHNLMPDELATLGLADALNEASRRLQEASGIPILFVCAGDMVALTQVAELAVYRAVLELMHNIIRHSQATEAIVQLVYHADILNITIEDNGTGFGQKNVEAVSGIGLKNVASRTQWLGGQLAIDTSPAGTTIRLDIPYV